MVSAIRIRITSKDQETQLRQQARGIPVIETSDPDIAYACSTCENVISFGRSMWTIEATSVRCPACGTENTI